MTFGSDSSTRARSSIPKTYGTLPGVNLIAAVGELISARTSISAITTVPFSGQTRSSILIKDVFDLPAKIVWRQTSSYFVGAFLGEGVWFGNTLQAGVLKPHYMKKFDLHYLLALLNAKSLRHLYINIVQEMGRVFPQVKLSKLKGLPVKDIPRDQQEPFVKLVAQIMSIADADDYLEDSRAQDQVHALGSGHRPSCLQAL